MASTAKLEFLSDFLLVIPLLSKGVQEPIQILRKYYRTFNRFAKYFFFITVNLNHILNLVMFQEDLILILEKSMKFIYAIH